MRRNGQSGVTLLETMISLVIMGMIAVILANTMAFLRRASDPSGNISAQISMAIERDQLRALAEAMPVDFGDGDARDLLEGTESSLTMSSFIVGSEGANVPVRVSLSLDDGTVSFDLASDNAASASHHMIADNVGSFRIRYLINATSPENREWLDAWSDARRLPDLVRLDIIQTDGTPYPPLSFVPAKIERQSEISLSSLLPPD